MTIRCITLCLCGLALTAGARAEDLAPGLWELSMDARIEAGVSFQPGPVKVNKCLTKDDARDPSKVVESIAAPGATGCSFSETSYVGTTLRFAMQCSGMLDLKSTGEVTFSATMIHGTIKTSSTIDGRNVEIHSVIDGRRLGDC